jgi:hypothetical protein
VTGCILCGLPAHGPYCHAHEWAAGHDTHDEQTFQNPSKEGVEITDLHDYWMERYKPGEVIELAAYLEEAAV